MPVDIKALEKRKKSLFRERDGFVALWKDCSKYTLPRAGRFNLEDRNKGDNRFLGLYDSTGVRNNRIYSAGMMGNMTSPAKPWFRLTTPDPKMMEID